MDYESAAKSRGCMITYPADGHKRNAINFAIKSGVNKVILTGEDRHYKTLFDNFGLSTVVKSIPTDDVNSVIGSVAGIISDVKRDHDEVSVLLLPSEPVIVVGTYIAACIEKVKVHAPVSYPDMKCCLMPLFPFVELNETERFVLAKIIIKREIDTKNLFEIIKEEEKCDMLYSESSGTHKDDSMLKCLRRILNKLEKRGLLSKEKKGRYFVWNSTVFGKFIF
ncbi:hypothetical protein BEH94_06895 [Candidatus Altiarchaeales archaeon WOR_SM1_SCG]|nr:hypothetical protein BEH94_06895 [Candidatus Altiarchaeales archaeon WOR_SM1_SCG]